MKKKRADELLYEHGHCESRQDAALLIMAGKVRSGKDALVTKPSQEFPADTVLTVDSGNEFVSRGGDAYGVLAEPGRAETKYVGYTDAEAVVNYIQDELQGRIGTEYAASQGRIQLRP